MASPKKPHIEITRDGPYRVSTEIPLNQATIHCDSEGVSLDWKRHRTYDTGKLGVYYLCRCGHSEIKPFCDGHHLDNDFKGDEGEKELSAAGYTDNAQLVSGPGIDMLDDPDLCVGAGFCERHGAVWDKMAETGDPQTQAEAVRQIFDCPSGRLVARSKDGKIMEPDLPEGISVVEDPYNNCRGPVWLQGGFELQGCKGETYETRNRMTLCRCGESKNKPFCDASHYNCDHMQGVDK